MKKELIKYYYSMEKDMLCKVIEYNTYIFTDNEFKYDDKGILKLGDARFLADDGFIPIDYFVAMSIINDKLIHSLIDKWNNDFVEKKKAWMENSGWPAKLVETSFELNGIRYTLYPEDVCQGVDYWEDGFMETIQKYLEKDLTEIGATNIYSIGFLD